MAVPIPISRITPKANAATGYPVSSARTARRKPRPAQQRRTSPLQPSRPSLRSRLVLGADSYPKPTDRDEMTKMLTYKTRTTVMTTDRLKEEGLPLACRLRSRASTDVMEGFVHPVPKALLKTVALVSETIA